jgi:hypothetical protein
MSRPGYLGLLLPSGADRPSVRVPSRAEQQSPPRIGPEDSKKAAHEVSPLPNSPPVLLPLPTSQMDEA